MIRTLLITGGIGSGKSEVCRYLAEKGVSVYNADSAAKKLYEQDKFLVANIEKALGCSLLNHYGQLDRRKLSSIVFSSSEALAKLESMVHPIVLEDFMNWRKAQEKNNWCSYAGVEPFVAIESAIILEKKIFDDRYDSVILVDAPEETRLERASKRDNVDKKDIAARMAMQNLYKSKADAIIVNDSSLEALYDRTDIAIKTLYLYDNLK